MLSVRVEKDPKFESRLISLIFPSTTNSEVKSYREQNAVAQNDIAQFFVNVRVRSCCMPRSPSTVVSSVWALCLGYHGALLFENRFWHWWTHLERGWCESGRAVYRDTGPIRPKI